MTYEFFSTSSVAASEASFSASSATGTGVTTTHGSTESKFVQSSHTQFSTTVEVSEGISFAPKLGAVEVKGENGVASVMVLADQSPDPDAAAQMACGVQEGGNDVARSDAAVVVCNRFRSKFICDVERTLGLRVIDFDL